jgi:hypothetical protein
MRRDGGPPSPLIRNTSGKEYKKKRKEQSGENDPES